MKILVEEVENEGLESFLGKSIVVLCLNYIYTGTLSGINKTCIKISGARLVYETGEWKSTAWKDAQALPSDWYIQVSCIESFGAGK